MTCRGLSACATAVDGIRKWTGLPHTILRCADAGGAGCAGVRRTINKGVIDEAIRANSI